jgi:hypothetical protein
MARETLRTYHLSTAEWCGKCLIVAVPKINSRCASVGQRIHSFDFQCHSGETGCRCQRGCDNTLPAHNGLIIAVEMRGRERQDCRRCTLTKQTCGFSGCNRLGKCPGTLDYYAALVISLHSNASGRRRQQNMRVPHPSCVFAGAKNRGHISDSA